MSREREQQNRRMLRARDAMDRHFAEPLDIPALAAIALVSEAHFIRTFRATFGETPHRYLQRRRVERAMAMLVSTDRSVTDVCMAVGFSSLGTFSRTFRDIVGQSPKEYRAAHPRVAQVPTHFAMAWTRPRDTVRAVSEKEPAPRTPSVAVMSYQGYLDTIEKKTGLTPQQLLDQAAERGFTPTTKAAEVVAWLKTEHGLGQGHAMAFYGVLKNGSTISDKHVGRSGPHGDASTELRLDGLANR